MPYTTKTVRHLFAHESSVKVSLDFPRTLTAEHTLRKFDRIKSALPITRIADLTPLDRLGLPVYCAVTPLARDLTTHMGKGRDRAAAKASAVMEACERVTAETLPDDAIRASYTSILGGNSQALDPRRFTLPPDTRFAPDRTCMWIPATDLIAAREVLIPADLVVCPPFDGILHRPDTNGLASGNTRLEAVVHGLCEVIERDAISQLLFSELYGESGDPAPIRRGIAVDDELPQNCRDLINEIEAEGLAVELEDITQDIPVPVFRATIVDLSYPTPSGPQRKRFPGLGCNPSAGVALSRALTEAVQSRLARIQGARDSFNRIPRHQRANPVFRAPPSNRVWRSVPSFESLDLADDLIHILGALEAAGFSDPCFVDLTRPDLQAAVVRVCVPGLSVFLVDQSRVSPRDLKWLI